MNNLSIKAVSNMVGISPFVLRAWEKRYKLLKPKRSSNNRRTYSLSEVEKLKLVIALKQNGHSLAELSQMNLRELNSLLNSSSEYNDKLRLMGTINPRIQIQNLLSSVSNIDLEQMAAQLKLLQLQLDTKTFLVEIVSPLLQQLGQDVADNKLEIYHEHAASALLRHFLFGLLYSTERATSFEKKDAIIIATPENDYHEFGALIASILATVNGHRVLYLGPNIPTQSLANAVLASQSPLVILASSAPLSSISKNNLKNYIQSLIQELPTMTHLWFGGARAEEVRSYSSKLRAGDTIIRNFEELDRKLNASGLF